MSALGQLTRYQRSLLGYLGLAVFFEGYDLFAISQTLPDLRAAFGLTPKQGSTLIAVVGIGMVAAYFFTRLADRWGRRSILCISLGGYPVLSGLSALCPGSVSFALCQLVLRIFLVSGIAIAVIYAAEEFPANRRGTTVGLLQVSASLGAIICAVTAPLLLRSAWGWRAVYAVGALPLLVVAGAPFIIQESKRFAQLAPTGRAPISLFRLLRTPYRKRMGQLALIWVATNMCTQAAIAFWKEHALTALQLTGRQVGGYIAIAALFGLPVTGLAGRAVDGLGRRRSAGLIYGLTLVGVLGAYWLPPGGLLICALVLIIGGTSSTTVLLNTLTSELFPTELRGDGMAWSSNLLGRLSFVLSPILVAQVVERLGWATSVSATALFLVLAVVLIWTWLPETAGTELTEPVPVS